ncbi:MAG: response regulator transcription factor [Alphaproteobacteria bacterium]|nr:response regulator transcription factor [Alphaproteobacteria bacterium]MBU1516724.1 response regulator transcription factor [Alphaproteobacteria bacterium]MBU2095902.1 response regulator transcription factor [Alphaproteobacteria bacterium]MBU2153606.1 response regulator transcription factor [Alphaproteobacteria bacterium]MBU2307350.1 response regulator transcription factor [Alphaproteobacteria bacterium]
MVDGSGQDTGGAPPDRGCLIVEDRPDTREWLAAVVAETFPDMAQATAGSLRDARRWLEAHAANPPWRLTLALIDLGLPDGSGVELVREISQTFPDALPVVATIYDDDTHLFDSLAAGAQGYVLKQERPEDVAACLRRIDGGEPPLSPSIARRMLERLRPQPAPRRPDDAGLSPRETEVLTLLARGLSAPEAARAIGLKPQTVAGYVKVIYQKLHVTSRAEAVLAAAERGLA